MNRAVPRGPRDSMTAEDKGAKGIAGKKGRATKKGESCNFEKPGAPSFRGKMKAERAERDRSRLVRRGRTLP